jgi:L-rhamnose mutarotase
MLKRIRLGFKIYHQVIVLAIATLCSCQTNRVKNEENFGLTNQLPMAHKEVKRVGMVIKIKPERLEEYLAVHADSVAGVRDLLTKYNLRNFSIFMTQLEDSNYYEFGYYEYWGDDFETDMKLLEAEPRNKAWLELCDPMQIPLEGEVSWKEMKRIYANY